MRHLTTALAIALAAQPLVAQTVAQSMDSSAGQLTVTPILQDLNEPWAIGHLPDGGVLITERDGAIVHLRADGSHLTLQGVPEVVADGQGGLLDILIPRDFAGTREIYLTYAATRHGSTGTALGRGTLSADGAALTGFQKLWQMAPGSEGGRHFGSRIVEAMDGTLFITLGDRGDADQAQNLSNHNGTVVRLTRTGAVPPDNPPQDAANAAPEIYSYGHRNPQGAALDPNGQLWVVEHGAKGGDEVNRVQPGANYGWPVISYGTHYSGRKIGQGTEAEGMRQPAHYWDPSIAPSGMMIYSGTLWPEWEGDIFVGSLKFDYISRLEGDPLTEVEQLQSDQTGRVRDISEGPDGAIWFLSVYDGALYKITP